MKIYEVKVFVESETLAGYLKHDMDKFLNSWKKLARMSSPVSIIELDSPGWHWRGNAFKK